MALGPSDIQTDPAQSRRKLLPHPSRGRRGDCLGPGAKEASHQIDPGDSLKRSFRSLCERGSAIAQASLVAIAKISEASR